ncbi:VWA domain-containing protein [Microbulbifer sp. THAF38]|uniref:VWA domain-containing protein n=1 Tax=Microbulbifer sp. THAF38 TaxID=2587856 RepID=UPI0012696C2E|nr:VWA domain-containing protein [Microbulbifer sp. THAF38]QFT57107.1 von Willebrand factor type A domain protein [Microbulbifer sp. THAF38]
MNKLQTALERALPIVAAAYGEQFGVNVVLSGTDAYTDGETIYLPLLDAMSELREVLFGYLAHEAAHVRSSDFSTLKKCKSPLEKSCTNLIEDIRIERLIQEVFPGTQFTLNAMWSYVVEQGMSPPATPEDNEATQLFQYLLHRLRSEVLHRGASTPLAESSQWVVEQTFPVGFFVRLDGLFGKYMDNLTCSDDCLKLARAILKALKDAEEEERQQQQSQDQQQQSSDSSQGDQSQQAGGSSGNGEGELQPKPGQADSSNGDDANQGAGDSQQSSGDIQAQDTRSGTQPSSAQDSPVLSGVEGQPQGGNGASLHERLINETNLPEDAVGQLREQLADQAREDNNGERVAIDTSSIGSDARNHGDTSSLKTGILASSTIRSRLLGLLQAQTRQKQWLHTRGKRVDGKRLTRLPTGDSRVFIRREEMQRPDTAVHVLLDCSGSMNRIQAVANQATVSLALAISTIPKCDIASSMFPGIGGEVSPILRRGQPVRTGLGRFAVCSSGGTPLAEAMLYAARELAASKRQRKVLIIITDGAPNNGGAVRYLNDLVAGYVDTYAIGIGSTAVSKFFEKWSVINDVKELQQALFTIAGQFLDLN